MKTKKPSRTANVIKQILNVRGWSDYDRIKTFTDYVATGIKKLFVPHKEKVADQDDTFKQVAAKLKLSEADLQARGSNLYRLSMIMGTVALIILGYSIYHIIYLNFKAVIISLAVMLIALVLAFRYHYWYFQIKERKLGCTLKEWYTKGLLGR